MEGLLISAYELSGDKVEAIEKKFSEDIGQTIELKQEVDRSLIGGFIVSVRHHRYDYSIKTKLNKMKNHLLEG